MAYFKPSSLMSYADFVAASPMFYAGGYPALPSFKNSKKMSKSKFKAGDKVRVRSWASMKKEFGMDSSGDDINTPNLFTGAMKHLCGRTAVIRHAVDPENIRVENWSSSAGDMCWTLDSGMFELASPASVSKIDKRYKIKVTPKQSEAVQKICFAQGIGWGTDEDKIIQNTDKKHLFINKGDLGFMCGGSAHDEVYFNNHEYAKISAIDFIKKFGGLEEAVEEGVVFDLKEMDRLVLDEDSKKEIEAVLKQHKFASKIFEEWGLGETIEYGRGMTMLFYGEPGTGKTWGATCMAKALRKELLVVGAADIQTSEPGGANRNIENAFKSAKEEGKLLFFDECDSLITDRANVGIILGSEINTLLTEIEKFEGVVILATNRIETLDKALERRISLILEFPEPDKKQREKIWEKLIPAKMPLGKGVTPKALAKKRLTGGQIKNVLLGAARKAVADNSEKVSLSHFTDSIDRVRLSTGLMGIATGPRAKMRRGPVRDYLKSKGS